MTKRIICMLLALLAAFSLAAPAFAAEEPGPEETGTVLPEEAEEAMPADEAPDAETPEEDTPEPAVEVEPETPLDPNVVSGSCGANVRWSLSDGVLTISGTGSMTNYMGRSNHAPWYGRTVTSAVIGEGVTSIGNEAFYECDALTSVSVPSTVTSIGSAAFEGCYSLASIQLPAGMTSIGERAFYDCWALGSVSIPDSVRTLGADAFAFCKGLTSVKLPSGLRQLELRAFNNCSSLTAVTVPSSVTEIGDSAFDGCSSLAELTLSDSLRTIGSSAFQGCALGSVTVPASVQTIGDWAFADCTRLTSVTILGASTRIGLQAFSNTPWSVRDGNFFIRNGVLYDYQGSGGQVVIPGTVTEVAGYAFCDDTAVTAVTIPASVKTIGQWAFGNTGITGLTVPATVAEIGSQAFGNSLRLASATVAAKKVGEEAFWYCPALTSVTLTADVSTVGDRAFADCMALKTLTVLGRDCAFGDMILPSSDEVDVVIQGYPGSTAETFAKANGYTFRTYVGQHKDGWVKESGLWYYIKNSAPVTGWLDVGRERFYFGPDGVMVTGRQDIDGKTYYFNESHNGSYGAMKTGWVKLDGIYYYFNKSTGAMVTSDWVLDGKVWYYQDADGKQAAGLRQINGKSYYLNEKHDGTYGAMKTGWVKLDGVYYYFSASAGGAMVTSAWVLDGRTWYYQDADGKQAAGLRQIGGKSYYLNEKHDGSYGAMKTGWVALDGTYYYFSASAGGAMHTGWLQDGRDRYYMDGSGAMLVGWQQIDGVRYYFNESHDGSYGALRG